MEIFSGLVQDTRYALRAVRRELGFSAFAALIVGLGVGANTAVFSVMSPLLLRPLPFEEPERLVWVALGTEGGLSAVTSRASNLRDYRELTRSFAALTGYFAFFEYQSYNLTGEGRPERLVGVGIVQNFLDVLGVEPLLGRGFVDEESVWGGRRAAILTHGFWQRRFGGDLGVVGGSISLNGEPTQVVGVLPASFDFVSTFAPASRVDFLWPFPVSDETDRWGNALSMIGRLGPGASVESAQADLDRVTAHLREADPERWGLGAVVTGLQDQIAGGARAPMLVLAAAAGAVMLVACANLSNLLLARGLRRGKEMAIRSVFGADRLRLIRQLTIESLVVALGGGLIGALLAFGVTRLVAATTAVRIPMLTAVAVDARALAFTLAVALAAGLLMGVIPAFQLSRGREAAAIESSARGSTEGTRSTLLRRVLVVGEVAVACVLLIGGGLLLRSFLSVLDVELGFQPEGAVAWRVDTNRSFADDRDIGVFYDDLVARVEALPGVEAAGLSDTLPLGRNRSWTLRAKGVTYERGESPVAFPRIVDHRYTRVMRIPLLAGRYLTAEDDADSAKAVLLNRTAAETVFPGSDPIGRTVMILGEEWQVVGVVGDVRHLSLEESAGLEMYLPFTQTAAFNTLELAVRSSLPVEALVGSVRSVLHEVDANMPSDDYRSLESVVDRAVSPRRFILALLGAFAGIALLLSALGIYAVLSFSVSQRTAEIGIRMALGESAGNVRRRVLAQTMRLAGSGVALGVATAFALSRLIRSLLHGVGPNDASTFAGVAVVLLLASALAGYLPARRASRTDPAAALR